MIEILSIAGNITFIILAYHLGIAFINNIIDMIQARKDEKVAESMEEEEAKVEKIIERLDDLLHNNDIKQD